MGASDEQVARLLKEYGSKPPSTNLTGDEKKELAKFVKSNRSFRKLKDLIRIQAWQQSVFLLNESVETEGFAVRFARNQGYRDGMIHAIDMLEQLVETEDSQEADDAGTEY